ncbi:growth hormone secretagogue receptor type 1-like [Plakobranchus ocellatus]|uniref:Growth hormone secretagogue receptor type 1-like n=1 Tax=Plakobranchus ocellatus TaxID=259542 RepID=A0AAV4DYA2_9GAST|nr:growth hormone secretagogue receptor type 1-like [Plakobranchus ocellatus]
MARVYNSGLEEWHNASANVPFQAHSHHTHLPYAPTIAGHSEVNTTTDFNEEMKKEIEYKVAALIWKICPGILYLFGTVGNVLILKCLRSLRLGPATMHIYLKALAISDLLALYSGLLRHWLIWLVETDIRDFHQVVCRFHTFLVYVAQYVSTWLLVMMTLERTCSACFPYRVNTFCTKRRAWMIILTIVVTHCIFNAHFLFLLSLEGRGSGGPVGETNIRSNVSERTTLNSSVTTSYSSRIYSTCDGSSEQYYYFLHDILPLIETCTLSLVPFILVMLGNITIVCKTYISLRTAVELNVASNHSTKRRRRRASTMTVMLLLISALFLVTSASTCVYNTWERSTTAMQMNKDPKGAAQIELAWACVNIIMYCNNTFNFYLYCLSGKKFRSEIKRQLSRRRTESHSNVMSGFSLQPQARYRQSQDLRNGQTDVSGLGNGHQNSYQAKKTMSVRHKAGSGTNQSNAYL